MKRTHTCGELTAKDIGKKVTLCGWVHRRRDHGKLIFIDIRDREGITQIVFVPQENKESHKKAEDLKSEYVISVTGEVRERPKGTQNKNITTGKVEVGVSGLEILNPAKTPPFEIDDQNEISEDLRFLYRYLDLRRPTALGYLRLRHKVAKIMRDFLDKQGFIEVETPTLTKSTPEGARDFLVPSRVNPDKFYALPQSPQLFKQILMVSGLEKYFQIVKCFRDEDLRADRQPEFTQLDIEMSFIDEEDIYALCEKLMQEIFQKILNLKLKIPFSRMTYSEAMEKYGTDKPDLRKNPDEFAFVWITDFLLFKYNETESRWETEHHPFTSPQDADLSRISDDPGKVKARAYDLVVNGVEIASGSIRIHDRKVQEKIFEAIGLKSDEVKQRFGFLLEAFTYGAPPHGGIASGLDRLVALLAKVESIREVIAFPKTQKAVCPLTGAPSNVSDTQLKELGLSLLTKKRRPKK